MLDFRHSCADGFDAMDPETSTHAVLRALRTHEDVGVTTQHAPLYDAIDPDALNRLFRSAPGKVTFEYSGLAVTVDHEDNVTLRSLNEVNGSNQ